MAGVQPRALVVLAASVVAALAGCAGHPVHTDADVMPPPANGPAATCAPDCPSLRLTVDVVATGDWDVAVALPGWVRQDVCATDADWLAAAPQASASVSLEPRANGTLLRFQGTGNLTLVTEPGALGSCAASPPAWDGRTQHEPPVDVHVAPTGLRWRVHGTHGACVLAADYAGRPDASGPGTILGSATDSCP